MTIDDHAGKIARRTAELQRKAFEISKSKPDDYDWPNRTQELADAAVAYANAVRNARRAERRRK